MWLEKQGWEVKVRLGPRASIDIEAVRGSERWVIEAKEAAPCSPCGSTTSWDPGEILQRMDDPGAGYSIALPDRAQFRALWIRLPQLRTRTAISLLLVGRDSSIVHLDSRGAYHVWLRVFDDATGRRPARQHGRGRVQARRAWA